MAWIANFVVKDRSDLSKSLDADTSKSKRGQKSGTQSAVKFDDGPQEGEEEEEVASPTALAMLDRLSQYVAFGGGGALLFDRGWKSKYSLSRKLKYETLEI